MGQFRNATTGVVVSVDDSKDERFADGWEPVNKPAPAKKAAAKKSSN
jgi:hypothetical protein